MRKVVDIYKEYKNMPMLAMHQIRTAAVALMICDSLSLDVDDENIVRACLIHDIGNIVKFNLNLFPKHNEPEGIDYWEEVKKEFIKKYSNDDHVTSLAIAKEIGVSSRIYDLINCIDSNFVSDIEKNEDFGRKICAYVDNRVSPHGVVSVEHHSLDARERYKNHPHAFSEEKRINFMGILYKIEKQIFSHSKIKPEDITDESVAPYIEKVKNFEL